MTKALLNLTASQADVAIITEGTYPFTRGGVAGWIKDLVTGMPDVTFALIFLGSSPEDYEEPLYTFPDNIIHFEIHYLFQNTRKKPLFHSKKTHPAQYKKLERLHQDFKALQEKGELDTPSKTADLIHQMKDIDEDFFLNSKDAWDYIVNQYEGSSLDPSFIDYFWTVRNLHAPLWTLLNAAKSFIDVKVIHSSSTGYAGFLAGLVNNSTKRPLIISEHGIYTKERTLDLLGSSIVKDTNPLLKTTKKISYLRSVWIRFFDDIAKYAYDRADVITNLYDGAKKTQIEMGAAESKLRQIPNGVNIPEFAQYRKTKPHAGKIRVALVGRMVSIKNVKKFILAIALLAEKNANVCGLVYALNTEEEENDYQEQCESLVTNLNLDDKIEFIYNETVDKILPNIDILVLCSISEGMALALLEGMAAGIPAVCSDVGANSDIVLGKNEEDRALGAAGRITETGDPQALVSAILALADDPEAYQQASTAAIKRIERYYNLDDVLKTYHLLYEELMTSWQA